MKLMNINANDFFNNKHPINFAVFLFFISLFFVGLFVFADYGITVDEATQRNHSLISYKYINRTLFNREIAELEKVEELTSYEHKYYGTAVQMPVVAIEDIFDFQLNTRQIYLIRHFYIFLICFTGYICFYLFLKKLFHSRGLALTGVMLIALYPRFFAYQFCDIKNMVFAALCEITLFFMEKAVEKPTVKNLFLFSLSAALATNQRIMGMMFPMLLVGYYLLEETAEFLHRFKNHDIQCAHIKGIKKYIFLTVFFFGSWYILTPASWSSPLITFYHTFIKFSSYDLWNGTMVFAGKLLTCEKRPWYYIFVWLGISVPLLYHVLFVFGHVYAFNALKTAKLPRGG